MKLRKVIALLMLSIYSVSICGYALTIILCHCPHSRHYKEHHCICAECAHAQTYTDGIKADDACKCKHKHTTEIALYDTAKQSAKVVAPVAVDCIAGIVADTDRYCAEAGTRLTEQHTTPLPTPPDIARRASRAPPVRA
ncbi:MAG: hypothetical protein ACI35M_00255 [Alistipes sp.]